MPALRHILGISAFYHDAAAALLRDGAIISAAQEERFSRKKNDPDFPHHAIGFCLRHAGLTAAELDAVVFYDKPILKFARLLETYLAVAPAGWRTFPAVLPGWLSEKLDLRKTIREALPGLRPDCQILFTQHHQAHAASAFYPSPFREAAILTIDGVGEWATTAIGLGSGHEIRLLKELRFPHSLGLLYSAFTDYCGFRINSGEYKLMGLAPYGEPKCADLIYRELLDLSSDGSFWLNLGYFNFLSGTTMTNARFHKLFGGPPRRPQQTIEQRHMDVARSIQSVTEEIMLRLARHAQSLTGQKNLCLAGGVALNCVANGRILRERIFERLWIQPAAGDAGGALGATLAAWHLEKRDESRSSEELASGLHPSRDSMQGAFLGPQYSDSEIEASLRQHRAVFHRLETDALLDATVQLLKAGKIVGWFQGRMEFGPRALGSRSILGDARSPGMQSAMNLKVKFRESFRPFAPVVLRERVGDYFDLDTESPYMLLVAPIKAELRSPAPAGVHGIELVKQLKSTLPAVTHVDYSARIQTVERESQPLLYELLHRFERDTGCGVLVNTSFNLSWEPIVCSPEEAFHTFMQSEMDALVIGHFLLHKHEQPLGFQPWREAVSSSPPLEERAGERRLPASLDSASPWADPRSGGPLVVTSACAFNPFSGTRFAVQDEIALLFEPTDDADPKQKDVTETVKRFYEETPFPNYDDLDNPRALLEKARRGLFARLLLEQIPYDARIVEIGCGTGQLTNLLAIAHRTVLGTDVSLNSLRLAQKFKTTHGLERAAFAQMNLFRPALRDGFFDFVISNGVLHHTTDARAAFARITRLARPGGYVLVGLYHRYARKIHYARRALFRWTGLANRWLDPQLGQAAAGGQRQAWLRDQYCHPHETSHTLEELLGWLEENDLEFVNAIPKPAGGPALSPDERLFERKGQGTTWSRWWSQLRFLPSGYHEGGYFLVIGRRKLG